MRRNYFLPAALLLALWGFWSPWLALPAAALRLNAFELSEWVTFLPAVRSGQLPLSRLAFLIPSACLAVLFSLAVGPTRRPAHPTYWWRGWLPDSFLGWGLVVLAALSVSAVFPYYPYLLTGYADPEFQGQYAVAVLTTALAAVALLAPEDVSAVAQLALAVAGAALCVWIALTLLPAAAALLGVAWPLGWGWALTLLGFIAAAVNGWRRVFQPRAG